MILVILPHCFNQEFGFERHKLHQIDDMKHTLVAFFSLVTGFLSAQTFEIPAEIFPYSTVFEWKGQGAMLMSKDPSENQKKVTLTMVGANGKSTWDEGFSPNSKELFYISEDGGRYAYFLEHLELNSGKVAMHQVNVAGNIKTNTVNFSTALKKIGDFQADDLRLLDIVTAEKALIYVFTHTDKTKNKRSTIAISMTHHNFLCYATLVAENVTSSSKVEDQVSWYMAGEIGESVVYAARTHAGKDAGWLIKEFNVKGDLLKEFTLKGSEFKFIDHERVGFGARGSALLNRVEPTEKGTLLVNNGVYYVGGVTSTSSTTSAVLETYAWKDNLWTKVAQSPLKNYTTKKTLQVGYFPMKDGIGWFVKSTIGEGSYHGFGKLDGVVSGAVNQQLNNPSRLMNSDFTGKFVSQFTGKWLVFDAKQLPNKGAITFEYAAQ